MTCLLLVVTGHVSWVRALDPTALYCQVHQVRLRPDGRALASFDVESGLSCSRAVVPPFSFGLGRLITMSLRPNQKSELLWSLRGLVLDNALSDLGGFVGGSGVWVVLLLGPLS